MPKYVITLIEAPGVRIEVGKEEVMQCGLLASMAEDDADESEIPLCVVSEAVLRKVIVFLEHHAADPMKIFTFPIKSAAIADSVGKWDADFIASVDIPTATKLIIAANYLDCKPLLHLACLRFAAIAVSGKPDADIAAQLGVKLLDFCPPETLERVKTDNMWVYEFAVPEKPANNA